MIKVLHVITGLAFGGAERMLVNLINETQGVTLNHRVVTLRNDHSRAHEIVDPDVLLGSLSTSSTGRPLGWLSSRGKFVDIYRDFKPDVIQTWLYHSDLFVTPILVALGARKKICWNLRNSGLQGQGIAQRVGLKVLAAVSRTVPRVISNSSAGVDFHRSVGYRPGHWLIIPNGFDPQHYRKDNRQRDSWRERLGISPGDYVIGNASRYDPNKDFASFFAAIARAGPSLGRYRILLVGEGCSEDNASLTSIAEKYGQKDRLIALGQNADVVGILNAMDVFLFTSKSEGFPNVIGEAILCERPVVATNCGDIASIVLRPANLCQVGDVSCLAARLISNHRSPAEMALAEARRKVVDRYSMKSVAQQYVNTYRAVTS